MSDQPKKNIIICADGTGNKGGYTPDSNVYKTYNGVDIHSTTKTQISFYDNGVGTSTNKILRGLGGALGIGFQRNVRDLYRYLAMNYSTGDDIYLFGFSRGAATVRAFLGFIATCGLVNGRDIPYDKLEEYTKDAFDAYKASKYNDAKAKKFREHKNSHGIVNVHFVGVWDTVSALGLPKWVDRIGFVAKILDKLFTLVDKVINLFWKHHFYKYELSNNIQHAYQALALDDERTSFWPMIWNEHGFKGKVEQVWFAGMHSNVGGGYQRAGLSNVALHWMLVRADKAGLKFKDGFIEQQKADANVNGRLYDSRDGIAILYRYHPREIANLCSGNLTGPIRIHETVLERMCMRTANYAPLHLPKAFLLTSSDMNSTGIEMRFDGNDQWQQAERKIARYILQRKTNYMAMITLVIALVVLTFYTWAGHVDYWGRSGTAGNLADLADFLTPSMFENLIELSIMRYPLYSLGITLGLFFFWRYNSRLRRKTMEAAIVIRDIINKSLLGDTGEQEGEQA